MTRRMVRAVSWYIQISIRILDWVSWHHVSMDISRIDMYIHLKLESVSQTPEDALYVTRKESNFRTKNVTFLLIGLSHPYFF